ncbi:MAG: rod shape-determining protein RodA [Spirochaetales bacterium]|nr:rod shape-determining protein RodA [Spirochaetales bacterium]
MAISGRSFSDIDWWILAPAIFLMGAGVLFIYSSGVTSEGLVVSNEWIKQLVWVASGLVLLVAVIVVDWKRWRDWAPWFYGAALVALVYTKLFGRVVNGARSWIGVGDVGVQPSEFTKIAAILMLAKYLADSRHDPNRFGRFLKAFAIAAIPMAFILIQPDFGTSLVFLPIFLVMAWIGGIETRYVAFVGLLAVLTLGFAVLPLYETVIADAPSVWLSVFYEPPRSWLLIGGLAGVFALATLGFLLGRKRYYYWIAYSSLLLGASLLVALVGRMVLKEYQVMRLIVFLDPSVDPRGSGWNILQSITAIGSGGFGGRGFLQGTQSHYRYLPQQSTDFIFSILSEEWGLMGGVLVFSLFFILLARSVLLLRNLKSAFASYVVAGVVGMVFFHFIINVGMAMGIMPITGIPLFFLSYGGSSLWTALVGIGLTLAVSARRFDL